MTIPSYQSLGDGESCRINGILNLIFFSVGLTILYIVEIIYLKFNGQYVFIYIILSIWLFLRCLSFVGNLISYYKLMDKSTNSKEDFCYIMIAIFAAIFQIDILFTVNYLKKIKSNYSALFGIQLLIYFEIINSFGLNIINIYLISDTTTDLDSNIYFYFSMLLIKQLLTGFLIMLNQHKDQYNNEYGFYQLISSVIINFSYWYFLIQAFMYFWIIGLIVLILNLTAFLFDLLYYKEYNQHDKYFISFFKIFQYLYSFNALTFSSFSSKSQNLELKKWQELLSISIQFFNVGLLFFFKLFYYPLITNIDIVFYVLLGLTLPLIYIVFINFYYKLKKQNQVNLQLNYTGNTIQIEKKAYKLISERFILSYKAEIEFDIKQLISGDKLSFEKSLQNINQFRTALYNSKPLDSELILKDTNQQIQLNLQTSQTSNWQQTIYFRKEFFENEQKEYILNRFCQFLLSYQFQIYFEFDQECKVDDIQRLMIQISSFESQKISLRFGYNQKMNENFYKIQNQIRIYHYMSLAFSKHISDQMYINPHLIQYDLYEEFM